MLVTRTSQISGKSHTMDLPITQEQINRFQNGEYVQRVFPFLSPSEREFLMTGIVDEEWNKIFKDEEK